MDNTRPLSELIAEQSKKAKESFRNSPDKDSNEYYEAKKKRIEQGIEELLIINEDEEDEE
ncbi:hypothetical protein [Priestia megaterium]|uniref:hypothetical protein n=1 Tax=Priestia megaterium TaxID=1404 RepID=UPI000BFB6E6B|nr:hypothetical protein [Priestia megaterium]PGO60652.1 hypothetical protein CN981_08875 [Priestia megaterium]